MISRPLLSMVAESTVMRRPMTQVGCLSACSGVMVTKSASGVLRKGPPEAVSQICLTPSDWVRRRAGHLVDGVVLGVDGQQYCVMLASGGEDEIAGGDEAFFVGEADGFAGEDGSVGGFEASDADDGRDDEVSLRQCGHAYGACSAVDDLRENGFGFEARGKLRGEFLSGQRDNLWTPAQALCEGGIHIGTGGKRDGMKAVGVRFADAEGALANRAGRAEEGDLLHMSIFAERGHPANPCPVIGTWGTRISRSCFRSSDQAVAHGAE